MKNKNYNRLALLGWDVDDMDIIKEYEIDESFAYTPNINFAVINENYYRNYNEYQKLGHTENEAHSRAEEIRQQELQEINLLMETI
jgi:hypothetical protein